VRRTHYLGRVSNPRPVATMKKLAIGRVAQRQVLTRMVGHGQTGFSLRSSRIEYLTRSA